MNWEAAGAIGEIVSAIGVIVTFIYLAVQIRSNTKESRLSATANISSEYNSYLQHITADPELSKLWRTSVDGDFAELSEDEQARIIMVMGNIMRILESAHIQYLAGRMDEVSWSGYKSLLSRGVNASMFSDYWQLRHGMHNKEFGLLIDELLKNPDTNPMFRVAKNDV